MDRTNKSNTVARAAAFIIGLPRRALIGLVRGYQLMISPWLPSSCRYYPTCSEYSIRAIREYGAVKGFVLTFWRILRCNPFAKGGYDPPRWFGEPAPPPPDDETFFEGHSHR